jgi:cardiolipin synthase
MNAEKSVHITTPYFIPDPQLLDALVDASRRGVDVQLILPSFSDFWVVFQAGRGHYQPLLDAGVRIRELQTAMLHSKTAVIDGVWSTIGSANVDPRSFVHNDEVIAVVLGRDFARQMEDMFRRDTAQSRVVSPEAWSRRPLSDRAREWLAHWWQYWL